MATDLQSAPFGHLGTCPKSPTQKFQRKKFGCEWPSIRISKDDGKRRAGWSTHSTPLLKIKEESDELQIQPCSGNG
jgi:hypothetical protein